jgi:hypothetical protein
LFYPLILIVNILGYLRAVNKKDEVSRARKKKVYSEILKLGIDPRILLDGHLIVEFEKENELEEIRSVMHRKYRDFYIST